MDGNEFIASEQKSGYGPEELEGLRGKIGEWMKKIDELNGDTLEVKAEMALKNKFITPEQEKELFDLINTDDLHNRYMDGEVTEDLLEELKGFYEKVKNKRDEIFPDAPKNAKLKLVKKEGEDADNKNKTTPVKKQLTKDKKEAFAERQKQKEELVDKLDAAYEKLYSFLNDKKDAPLEVYDSIREIGNELRDVVKYRGEAGDIVEKIKSKYKKDNRQDSVEHQIEAPEAKLSPEKMEIFEKFGQEFYNTLKNNVSWEGYDEEKKLMTLEIQTGVFLTKQLKKLNLVGEDKIAGLVESWVKEINK